MATFYTGYRPVHRGQNSNDWVNPYTGETAEYSNWSIYSSSQLLEGAPNHDHVPGEGRHPHGLQYSRWFRGLDDNQPLADPGNGARLEDGRYGPLEYRGIFGVFGGTWGHTPEERSEYSAHSDNYFFRGVPSSEEMVDPGHAPRGVDGEGTASTFGRFNPFQPVGRDESPMADPGQEQPDRDHLYGHNRTQEWFGVPSSKALSV